MVPGQPASLAWRLQPERRPGPREVLVRVLGVPLAPVDHRMAAGEAGSGLGFQVLGSRGYGRIAGLGSGVTGLREHGWVWIPDLVPDGCPACLAGEPDVCQGAARIRGVSGPDGTLQPLLVLPAAEVVPIRGAAVDTAAVLGEVALGIKALDLAARLQRSRFWRPRSARVAREEGAVWTMVRRLLERMGVQLASSDEAVDLVLVPAGTAPGPLRRDGVAMILASPGDDPVVAPVELAGNALVWQVSGVNRSHLGRAGVALGELEREQPGSLAGLQPPRIRPEEALAALRGPWRPATVEFTAL